MSPVRFFRAAFRVTARTTILLIIWATMIATLSTLAMYRSMSSMAFLAPALVLVPCAIFTSIYVLGLRISVNISARNQEGAHTPKPKHADHVPNQLSDHYDDSAPQSFAELIETRQKRA